MKARELVILCGAASMLASAPALAQTTREQRPPQQQPGDRNTAPRDQRQQPDQRDQRNTDGRMRAGSNTAGDTPQALQELAGVWRVQVSVSPQLIERISEQKKDAMREGRPGAEPARTGEQPGMTERNRDLDRDPMGRDTANAMTFTGFAENALIMNGSVLRQTVLMPDMGRKLASGQGARPGEQRAGSSAEAYGIAFLGFDKNADMYNAAFISGHDGTIHYSAGKYDASQRRIVFDSRPDTSRERLTGAGGAAEPVKVVVEQINPDQYRVTMYKAGADMNRTETPDGRRPGERDTQLDPDRRDPARDNNPATGRPNDTQLDPDRRDPARNNNPAIGRPNDTQLDPERRDPSRNNNPATGRDGMNERDAGPLSEGILYRAVYTRAEGADAQRFTQMLQQFEQRQANPDGRP